MQALSGLLQTVFNASLRTEEGESIRIKLAISPAGTRPKRRHQPYGLGAAETFFIKPIPLNQRELVKLANAVDPSVSMLSVHLGRSGKGEIVGLADEEARFEQYRSYAALRMPGRAGSFQVEVSGIGDITVYVGFSFVALYQRGKTVKSHRHIFEFWGLHDAASAFSRCLSRRLLTQVSKEEIHFVGLFDRNGQLRMEEEWKEVISRVLYLVRSYRHGGSILITPRPHRAALSIKYPLLYDRLFKTIVAKTAAYVKVANVNTPAWDAIAAGAKQLKSATYATYHRASRLQDRIEEDFDNCCGTVAAFSRVDGAVLMGTDLSVRGFGAEIVAKRDPRRVILVSATAKGRDRISMIDPRQFGTRHRSAIRYCWEDPKCVAFVVSQDGDVRVIMRVDDGVMVFDNVRVERLLPRTSAKYKKLVSATADAVKVENDVEWFGIPPDEFIREAGASGQL